MRSGHNSLTMEVYGSGTTAVTQAVNELSHAGGISFNTGFPGGLYLDGAITVPRQIMRWWPVKGNQRVVVRNGMITAFEGWIDTIDNASEETAEGVVLNLIGGWGRFMMRRHWNKAWAEGQLTEEVLPIKTGNLEDKFNTDRYNRLCAIPKDGIAYANGDECVWAYTPPTGETVKRVTFNYNLQEGAQAWELLLWDNTNSSTEWNVTASGSGSEDHTLATPSSDVWFSFKSKAVQTGIGDGSIFGRFSSIVIYSETGAINLTEIAKDIRAEMSELTADDGQIGSNTFSLVPFVTQGFESMADILNRACEAGDASFNSWAAQILESEMAAAPDGKPVLSVVQYPALTDYDYAVRVADDNLVAPFAVTQDFAAIANWIIVNYTDSEGKQKTLSPDNDADLKDTTSITDYGQREYKLDLGQATITEAENAGRRYLARYKDPLWMMTNPIVVRGWIRAKSGAIVPSSLIRAGKRIKVEDYPMDMSGQGLTFMISHTSYSDDDESCAIQAGPPPDFIYALSAAPIILPDDPNAKLKQDEKKPASRRRRRRRQGATYFGE